MVFAWFLILVLSITVAPLAGALKGVFGKILKKLKDFLIFALNKESGCNPDSPCETSNSRMPSLSISATAAPVPNPKGSSPLLSWICFNSPSLKILKSLFGSPMLFIKISSKPSLSKSAEIIVLTLDGIWNSELAMS